MSTQINITVGSGGLSDRAMQQQQAARQAQLEKERQQRIEAQGTEQRNAKLQAEGKAPDGSALYGVNANVPQIERRPAAFRSTGQGLNLGHMWTFSTGEYLPVTSGVIFIQGGSSLNNNLVSGERSLTHVRPGATGEWITLQNEFSYPAFPTDATVVPFNDSTGTRTVRHRRSSNSAAARFLLPAGNGNFIYIVRELLVWGVTDASIYHHRSQFSGTFYYYSSSIGSLPTGYASATSATGYSSLSRAYICNNTTIREIAISTTLGTVLEAICSVTPTLVQSSDTINGQVNTYEINAIPFWPEGGSGSIFFNGEGFKPAVVSGNLVYTPSIFEAINNYAAFVPSTSIKTFPSKLKWGLPDASEGAYASPTIASAYTSGLPFYHGLWPKANEEPPANIWNPGYTGDLPKRVDKATLEVTIPPTGFFNVSLLTVWDWDDPAYCRSMCRALGFTDADLTP